MKTNPTITDVRKALQHMPLKWAPKQWLNTKIPSLNNVIGHPEKGIPYGRMMEVFGWECLAGDTFIDTPRDLTKDPHGIPIKDLVGKKPWVYSFDQTLGRIVLKQASRVWIVGRRKVFKVTFSVSKNSVHIYGKQPEFILATESHPFMLRERSESRSKYSPAYDWESQGYRQLKDLKPGDRIMPFFRKRTSGNSVIHLNNGTDVSEHRFILSEIDGDRDGKWDGHHEDENHLNNSVDNLKWMTESDHQSLHMTKMNLEGKTGWQKHGFHPRGMLGKKQSPRQRKRASETITKYNKTRRAEQMNHRVKKIEFHGYEDVYDMTVPGTENFVANGVVVHNSHGKTAIVLALAALAQSDGAHVIWGDIENSFEADWAIRRGIAKCPVCENNPDKVLECKACDGIGVDSNKFTLIQPFVGKFGKEREERLCTAQELCAEITEVMTRFKPPQKSVVVVDSVAALETEAELSAGIEGANMSTSMALAKFMGRLCKNWVAKAQIHNAWIVQINQLRSGPSKGGFGPSDYTTGGNAVKFYSHVRIKIQRVADSKITDKGKTIGIKGVITAKKNKTGGEEGAKIGYRLLYKGKIEFVPAKDVISKE